MVCLLSPSKWTIHFEKSTSAEVTMTSLLLLCSRRAEGAGGARRAGGVDVDARDRYNRTPLHRACETAHVEVARLLLEHDADVRVTDVCGRTPLHWAAEVRQTRAARVQSPLSVAQFEPRTTCVKIGCGQKKIGSTFQNSFLTEA